VILVITGDASIVFLPEFFRRQQLARAGSRPKTKLSVIVGVENKTALPSIARKIVKYFTN
jgi:hypothetical protein